MTKTIDRQHEYGQRAQHPLDIKGELKGRGTSAKSDISQQVHDPSKEECSHQSKSVRLTNRKKQQSDQSL